MIVITGANGHLGRAIVEQLLQRVPAKQVAASVRQPEKATELNALGVRVRKGDFDQPESLTSAFEGARLVLLVSSNARAYGGDTLAQHRAAIDAAREAGVQRIVYTSQMAASEQSAFPPMLDHAATEKLLAESGLAWTALRHGFYAASCLDLLGDVFASAVVAAPKDGKVAWTAHSDLAEAAARILTGQASFDGPTPPLTASQALDMQDAAESVSGLLGRPVQRKALSDDEFRAAVIGRGAPEKAAKMLLGLYIASRKGEFAKVDPTLAQLLGRPPLSLAEVIATKLKSKG